MNESITPETVGQNDAWPGEKNRAAGTYRDKDGSRAEETTIVPEILGPTVFHEKD